MRTQLHPADRDRLVAFLKGPLCHQVAFGATSLTMVSEAEASAQGGIRCTLEDQARAAELLSLPELRDADPAIADAVTDAALAMAALPVPCGAVMQPQLEVRRADPRDFEVLTPFHRFTGDLARGEVRQGLRGRTDLPPVMHSGNLVEFRIGLGKFCIDAEDTITRTELREEPGRIVLVHESTIRVRAGLLRRREVVAGTLRYEYEIGAATPLLRVAVTFEATRRLSKLRVTTAADALDEPGLAFAAGRVLAGGAWRDATAASDEQSWAEGPVEHAALAMPGGPALHLRPADPGRTLRLRATSGRPNLVHWLLLRHATDSVAAGGSFRIEEARLLARSAGAEGAAAAMALADKLPAGLDLEPVGPSGLLLHALATQLHLNAAGAWQQPAEAERAARLAAAYERDLSRLLDARDARALDLAFGAISAEMWAGAGDRYASACDTLLGRLLAMQRDGVFRDPDGTATFEGHAAALLALARAGHRLPEETCGPAVAAALDVLRPAPAEGRRPQDSLLLSAGGSPLRTNRAQDLGLVTRALRALVDASETGRTPLPPQVATSAREMHRVVVAMLRPLVRVRRGMLEVGAHPGGEGGAAAQASLMMALMAPDSLALQPRAVPSAA
ncbi:MAG TPA: hypothetical protein VE033_18980 [Acetobacteraceae bacterium]|nr:hypothetical protein [Acetobacteraceae bacterium]